MATTQMQPTDARKAFPCFDEPHLKATFNVTLWRRPHMKSLSNAELLRTRNECAAFSSLPLRLLTVLFDCRVVNSLRLQCNTQLKIFVESSKMCASTFCS